MRTHLRAFSFIIVAFGIAGCSQQPAEQTAAPAAPAAAAAKPALNCREGEGLRTGVPLTPRRP